MIRPIVTDANLLSHPSAPVCDDFLAQTVIEDLTDTAKSLGPNCAGLAAIQIGFPLRIFVVRFGDTFRPFVNPVIVARTGGIKAHPEGCYSLPGKKKMKRRFKEIKLSTGERFKGDIARALQHEMDHLDGVTL